MENSKIAQRIKSLQNSIREYKSTQKIGSDSVRTYANHSGYTWDVNWLGVVLGGGSAIGDTYRVSFKSDTQIAPFGNLRVKAYFGEGVIIGDEPYDPLTPSSQYLVGKFVGVEPTIVGRSLESVRDSQTLQWDVRFSTIGDGFLAVSLKFIVDANDTGKVSWYNMTTGGTE